METGALSDYLDALAREDCYRVDAVLKESACEVTQRVFFCGANGAEAGPYIRKFIRNAPGFGGAYERIFSAQRNGARFKHIPKMLECYRHGEDLVVVMECVRGETLQDLVYSRDPSVSLAHAVFPGLCDAVAELHEGFEPPIIHRDLKPSNVMVANVVQPGPRCPVGGGGVCEVAIIDFGIAREFREGADDDTTHFGTRAFAPPEQFGFGQTTVRSDVYALGMLLYFCLVEEIPGPEVRKSGFADERIPAALRRVIAQATALDPAQRFAGATALKAAFLAACDEAEAATEALPVVRTATSAPSDGASSAAGSETPQAAAPIAAEPPRAGFLSRFRQALADEAERDGAPHILGRMWNAVVVACMVALCVFVFWHVANGLFNPAYANPISPARAVFSIVAVLPLFLLFGFACLDKRRLKRRFPALARMRAWQTWAVVVACYVMITALNRIIFGA